ncbi:MAG: non-ribosomal peptide synthetase, partial [Pseudacidovorax sp.]|nr:non-ribosomal peptide synthetase [Pseudacidovorax sp.]
METAVTRRIAERFSRLDPAQRRVVYQGLREKGLTPGQFPILARQGGAADGSAPVSYAQMRQWFLWQLDPQSTAYHISGALRLSGALAADLVRASLEVIVARHAALRTVFRVDAEGGVEQVVRTEACFDFTHIDLAAEPAAQHEALAMQAAQRIANTPFDLVNGPLLRAGLIRMADDTHVLVLVMHHIVSDGWSLHLMMDEFAALYRSCGSLTQAGLTRLPVTYADYAVWQRNWMEAGEQERQLDHWRAQLGGRQPVLQLPADHGRRTDGRYTAATHAFALPRALKQALQSLAQDRECTLFMVLLTAFQALLYRCSGQDDVRVGVPIANRHRVETEGLVGFFVNTQVLRGLVDPRQSLLQLLAQTREAALGAQANQDLPFEQLVEALQPERIPGIHPLFQVLFNHQRGGLGALESIPGLALAPFVIEGQAAQFELMLITEENPDGRLEARFSYAAELFDAQTIERMAGHYLALLRALAEHPEQAVGDVALMDEAETLQ